MAFLRIIVYIVVLGASGTLKATESGSDKVFLVVGYSSSLALVNPEMVSEDKKEEAQRLVDQTIQARGEALIQRVNQWRDTNQLISTIFNSAYNKFSQVMVDLSFSGENSAHYFMFPMIFEGQRRHLDQALSLSGESLLGGAFKVQEVLENRYVISATFGFYDGGEEENHFNELIDHVIVKKRNFDSMPSAFQDQIQSIAFLIQEYRNGQEYKREGITHLMRYVIIQHALLDLSWVLEGFIPGAFVHSDPRSHSDGKIMIRIGLFEDALELKQP